MSNQTDTTAGVGVAVRRITWAVTWLSIISGPIIGGLVAKWMKERTLETLATSYNDSPEILDGLNQMLDVIVTGAVVVACLSALPVLWASLVHGRGALLGEARKGRAVRTTWWLSLIGNPLLLPGAIAWSIATRTRETKDIW